MKAHVFMRKQKSEATGYWNTSFHLQGVGLSGLVPIRVCYFGKPVMEPVLEKDVDPLTGKVRKDKDGKELLIEKKDKDGKVVMAEKLNEKGEVVLRDDDYSVRMEVLEMYAGNYREGVVCNPVDVVSTKSGDKTNVFVVCGDMRIPVEVVDFSNDERPDYSYRANCKKLQLIAGNS